MPSQLSVIKLPVNSSKICDGRVHCYRYEDELHPSCGNRVRCSASDNRLSIAPDEVCDGTIDCDNGSDETNTTCPERFFCSSFNGSKVH